MLLFDMTEIDKTDIKRKKDQAIASINSLLDKENIVSIIYIDDKVDKGSQEIHFSAMMKNARTKGSISSSLFGGIQWQLPELAFEKEIKRIWDSTDNKAKIIHRISKEIGDNESSNIIPVLEIEDLLKDRITTLTPAEWIENHTSLFNKVPEGKKLLCLFDFQLEGFTGPSKETNGAELIKTLSASEYNKTACCGIFSHKYGVEDEDEYRLKYAQEFDVDSDYFYTISKYRFAYDPKLSAFAEGIKNVISLKYIQDLKRKSTEIIEKSNTESLKQLNSISPKTFNQIVQKSSYEEGIWEIKSLFRVNSIINDFENYSALKDDEIRKTFEESITKIRDLDSADTGYDFSYVDPQALDLRTKEIYLDNSTLNKLNLPIANGDIFQIGTERLILLVQPCNLSIRNNGKRGRDYNKGILVPIKKMESNKYNSSISSKIINPSLPKDYFDVAFFPEYKILSLDILDLTVFNENSYAILDTVKTDISSNLLIQESWKSRYKYIHKAFIKHKKAYLAFNEIKNLLKGQLNQEVAIIDPYLNKPICMREFKIGNHKIYDYATEKFNFNVERLNRYKSKYSSDLLQSFMSYLSRNGFDADFLE